MANSGSNDLHQVMAQLRRLGGEGDSLAALWQHRKTALENSTLSKEIIQQLAWAAEIDKKCANRQLVMDSELSHLLVQSYKEIHGALASYNGNMDKRSRGSSEIVGEVFGKLMGKAFLQTMEGKTSDCSPQNVSHRKMESLNYTGVYNDDIRVLSGENVLISGIVNGDLHIERGGSVKLMGVVNGDVCLEQEAKLIYTGIIQGEVYLHSLCQMEGAGIQNGEVVFLSN